MKKGGTKSTPTWALVILGVMLASLESMSQGRASGVSGGRERAMPVVTDNHLDRSAAREPTGLILRKIGWDYNCMGCHGSLEAKWHLSEPLMEHRDLELNHGNNRFCMNCHHPENRNAFVDYDGSEIAQSEVVQLCAKCHGPQHRDWLKGSHGRRNGYWDRSMGSAEKLVCIQCHDPHDPGFKPMKPLPGPSYPARAAGHSNWLKNHTEEDSHHAD